MDDLMARLNNIGFERSRRAVAALSLGLLISFFLFLTLVLYLNGVTAWVPAFGALTACYVVAFMGVAAEWFWGRWFAGGLGWSGVMVVVAVLVITGGASDPILLMFGALHGLVVLMLAGTKMAARFDEQPAWRERYGMDDHGVARLRKTVTRASASLPSVIIGALGPKEQGQAVFAAMTLAAGVFAVGGLVGVVRARAWGLLALAGAAAALVVGGAAAYPHFNFTGLATASGPGLQAWGTVWAYRCLAAGPALPILLLAAAVAPFVGPATRFLRPRH